MDSVSYSYILLFLIFMKNLFHCKCIQMFALSMSMSGCSDLFFAVMLRILNTSLTRHRGSFTDRKQSINAKYGFNEWKLAKVGPEITKYKLHIMDKYHVQCVSHPFDMNNSDHHVWEGIQKNILTPFLHMSCQWHVSHKWILYSENGWVDPQRRIIRITSVRSQLLYE